MSQPVVLSIFRGDQSERITLNLSLHVFHVSLIPYIQSHGAPAFTWFCWIPSRLIGDTFSLSDRRTAYAYNPEPPMYAPSSAASYFEGPGSAQVTVAGSSPPVVPSHSMVGITMDVGGTPIVSSAGAYLIHGGMDSARHSLAHTSRSSPATVGTRLPEAAG